MRVRFGPEGTWVHTHHIVAGLPKIYHQVLEIPRSICNIFAPLEKRQRKLLEEKNSTSGWWISKWSLKIASDAAYRTWRIRLLNRSSRPTWDSVFFLWHEENGRFRDAQATFKIGTKIVAQTILLLGTPSSPLACWTTKPVTQTIGSAVSFWAISHVTFAMVLVLMLACNTCPVLKVPRALVPDAQVGRTSRL